jgi:hypothetical protein
MSPLVWLIDGMAELVVAKREDRMLCEISRHAYAVAALYAALAVALLVLTVS